MSQMVLCKLDGFTCGDVGVHVSEVERIQVVSGRNGDATQFLFEVGTVFEMVLCVTNQGREDASHLFGNAAEDGVAGCNDGAHGVDLFMDLRVAIEQRWFRGGGVQTPIYRSWNILLDGCQSRKDGGFVGAGGVRREFPVDEFITQKLSHLRLIFCSVHDVCRSAFVWRQDHDGFILFEIIKGLPFFQCEVVGLMTFGFGEE